MNDQSSVSFLDRTLRNLRQAWRDIAVSAFGAEPGAPDPDLTRADAAHLRRQMQACLEARGGEVSARASAARLGRTYLGLNPVGKRRFFQILATELDIDREAVDEAMKQVREAKGRASRRRAEALLRILLEAPRVRLLRQFNGLPEGIKFLVDMRADLLTVADRDTALAGLEDDLRRLLASWFDIGFLELHRITWSSPATLLEKLIAYEAVHEIESWQDLKNRLDSDRRCFAFFHPSMPDEPLIFVEVALTSGMADSIQNLLDLTAPAQDAKAADTAIFYSISNAQKGLAGISFGGFLIKRVVDHLASEFPKLRTFATLSPIPGFRRWLDDRLVDGGVLLTAEQERLAALAEPIDDEQAFQAVLDGDRLWHAQPATAKVMERPLCRLVARYLLDEKHARGDRARDPVAHFHLSNGARVERINWLADVSSKGLRQSAGVMVNYLYKLEDIEANHEAYTAEGNIAAASAVRAQARG